MNLIKKCSLIYNNVVLSIESWIGLTSILIGTHMIVEQPLERIYNLNIIPHIPFSSNKIRIFFGSIRYTDYDKGVLLLENAYSYNYSTQMFTDIFILIISRYNVTYK
jgi:hypothetical protein